MLVFPPATVVSLPVETRLKLDSTTGQVQISLNGQTSFKCHSEATLEDGTTLSTAGATSHVSTQRKIKDKLGSGTEIVIRHLTDGKPELRQTIRILDRQENILVKLSVISKSPLAVRSLKPIVTDQVSIPLNPGPIHCLFVPYDNDNYFRYDSDNWGEGIGNGEGSYEVGAVYEDKSRNGLIVGSINHDTWKSAIRFERDSQGQVRALRAVAGVTSKYTHDQEPHGVVTGKEVDSPTFLISYAKDWRQGLEHYADVNALVQPALPWTGGTPFAWNSWSGHKDKVTARDAQAATDFVKDRLPWFRNGGTAYINFDSFWDNLKPPQLEAFVADAHAKGLKAGIYYTPFTGWGNLKDPITRGNKYLTGDLVLKKANGEPLPRLDGGWPLDPTHPGTQERIDRQLEQFVKWGFDYVKLDFMTHGALEGKHYDPKITTGTQAYRVGMKRIVDDLSPAKIGRSFFISLSIAPMFPSGYAHSRRISCDVFANIGATEYFLNSANYGWWTGDRLYRFNDPDSATVYQPLGESPITEAESRSRFTASAIGGGMMIEGDDLTKPDAEKRVLEIYSNREMLAIAKPGIPFKPVSGDTGSKAGDTFVRTIGKTTYLALFNFSKTDSATRKVSLERLGLEPGKWKSEELWTKTKGSLTDRVEANLAPMDCAVYKLTRG